MERISDFDEDEIPTFDELNRFDFTRDSIAISETREPVDLNELITELYLIPGSSPPQHNVK